MQNDTSDNFTEKHLEHRNRDRSWLLRRTEHHYHHQQQQQHHHHHHHYHHHHHSRHHRSYPLLHFQRIR
ncbi:hypothetical protein ALC60_08362 [Trachymyrmex zeteki]|uniref:Uncharacterized protein n=1 Tax=Mycetomoellerius zeteki TaxID=64791 RepID=A0A151WX71_9HYME|nr:hypothetical protein ALC60_08362 [Trachymyrmex zeteki]